MSDLNLIASRIEQDIRLQALQSSEYKNKSTPNYQHSSGRRLNLKEVLAEGVDEVLITGALKITYSVGNFMTVDRIVKSGTEFSRKRRMIFELDTKSGQISAALLIAILKIENGSLFNKYELIEDIATEYFSSNGIHISSSEINETYSRMMRKTFSEFFSIEGRELVKNHFLLKMDEIVYRGKDSYTRVRHKINKSTRRLLREMNRQYC